MADGLAWSIGGGAICGVHSGLDHVRVSAPYLYLSLFEVGLKVSLVYRRTRRSWEGLHDLQGDTALASMARDQEASRKWHTEFSQHPEPPMPQHLLTFSDSIC